MEFKIIVAGIGPGAREYVVPKALKAIENAKVLVGGSRALADFAREGQKTFAIKADIKAVMNFIGEELKQNDVVVMVSGDPGYYSLLSSLRKNFSLEQIKVIPGLSSMQVAFAKIALPWQEASLLSFHGRVPKDEDLVYVKGRIIGMLTDNKFNSGRIAEYLIERGWDKNARAYICSRLSYPDEKIACLSLEEAQTKEIVSHCVMIVEG
ncbi:precorrin-6y C5,15-methyltransferase (decarboxylating) subunit CbiE [Megamonas hypermegale]|uniref:precorrin-6y C5,15-methyltransferase (decarboxylating) subunit CbiE n=1 Tax=Megamonas hypermegale TaxID=158847 RepID=UPI000B39E6FD|nr:precorrin-6y C5,15-methyltransferase (decarboxylating) subunit CbiE [Megamonas hypermegale]OUO39861.1 precorrin-6y C5,15-methyltransferase (decarboxylating) subunit CbiE [Megamonas hypermegale]HJG08294.1 precorrin-6y C5,15-methyltransferase (decarboxylating) subunit CbiE [Megamonas hypermegale]